MSNRNLLNTIGFTVSLTIATTVLGCAIDNKFKTEDLSQTVETGTGETMLTWSPPKTRNDGAKLDDLAGYKIYYGTSKGHHPNMIEIRNPSATSYTVKGLSPNTYYFVIKAYDILGKESDPSNEVYKTLP
jgi:Fibronectin type III domain